MGEIAAAGLDVLKEEPMSKENPLAKIKDSNKLLITPHIAWASVEARTRLMKIIEERIKEFFICRNHSEQIGYSALERIQKEKFV